jgi:hypothetical protein
MLNQEPDIEAHDLREDDDRFAEDVPQEHAGLEKHAYEDHKIPDPLEDLYKLEPQGDGLKSMFF